MPSPPPASIVLSAIPSRLSCRTSLLHALQRRAKRLRRANLRADVHAHAMRVRASVLLRGLRDRFPAPAECRCRICARATRSRYMDASRRKHRDSRAARTALCFFSLRARAASSSSSASLSTLNCKNSRRRARDRSPPLSCPLRKTRRAPRPRGAAASTRSSSPPETISKPAPRSASSFRIAERRIRLHRIAHQVVATRERLLKERQPLENLVGGVDVERRAELLRQPLQRNLPQ